MPARVPLDVDLEDKLLYGLTPLRLGYLVVALLASFSIWTSHWTSPIARGSLAILAATLGACAAWGRWRGRPVDSWLVDLALFVMARYHFAWRRRK